MQLRFAKILMITGAFLSLLLTVCTVFAPSTLAAKGTPAARSVPSATMPTTSLQSAWTHIVESNPDLTHATVSAYAYDLTTHRVLCSVNAGLRQTPASVTKLVTTALGLDQLGPSFHYVTTVRVNQQNRGVGPIYLVGGGDPLLESDGASNLEAMAAKVAKSVKRATQVVGVSSLFPPNQYGLGWNLDDLPDDYAPETTSLMTERAEIPVLVRATAPGRAPSVHVQTNGPQMPGAFSVVNNATTVASGHASTLSVTRLLGTNTLVLHGTIAAGTSQQQVLSINNPPLFSAELFQALLKQDGVQFSMPAATGWLPASTTTLDSYTSNPLSADIKFQNQYSINPMAENLLRMVSVSKYGLADQASVQATIDGFLQHVGIAPADMQLVDGSGVSPLDEMTARGMVDLLTYAAHRPWFKVFEQSLMRVNNPANSGVLRWHPFALPAGTAIWVKTGNLSNQWNYAGYTKAENGNLIAFAVLDGGPSTDSLAFAGSPLDEMLIDAASWPHVPRVARSTASASGTSLIGGGEKGTLPTAVANRMHALLGDETSGSPVGAAVVNAQTGQLVWQWNATKLLPGGELPRLGLLTAVLEHGPAQFGSITVRADGTVTNGVLNGSLVVNGNDNPSLNTAMLAQLAVQVEKSGIRSTTRPLEYVDHGSTNVWPGDMFWNEAGVSTPPLSAWTVNDDAVTITLHAAGPPSKPTCTVMPASAPIQVKSQVTVVANGSSGVSATMLPGTNHVVLSGSMDANSSTNLTVTPPDAARMAAGLFQATLNQAGIQVAGTQAVAEDGTGRIVASIPGSSVTATIPDVLNNLGKSALQDEALLGSHAAKYVANELGQTDLIQDAAALGTTNYVTPDSIATLLAHVYHDPKDTPLKDALLDKLWTGTMPEVQTCVGYVQSGNTLYGVVFIEADLPR